MVYKNNNYSCLCKEYPEKIKYFKEEWFCENISIPEDKPDIDNICDIFVNPIIKNIILIDTEEGLSNEGQFLSGKKLLVELSIQTKINYVAKEPTQSLFSINYETIRSMFIVVPNEINSKNIKDLFKSSRLIVSPFVEHTYTKEITPRCFNLCILLFLDAQVC